MASTVGLLPGSAGPGLGGSSEEESNGSPSLRHILPKTNISHTILHENPSCDRLLSYRLDKISRRQNEFRSNFELARRAFIDRQIRKHKKWKRDDETRSQNMNFPALKDSSSKPKSAIPVYRSPHYLDEEKGLNGHRVEDANNSSEYDTNTLLPYMRFKRERTEIFQHDDRTLMTRLPALIQVDASKLSFYNSYCSVPLANPGAPVRDGRFQTLVRCLQRPAQRIRIQKNTDPHPDQGDSGPNSPGSNVLFITRMHTTAGLLESESGEDMRKRKTGQWRKPNAEKLDDGFAPKEIRTSSDRDTVLNKECQQAEHPGDIKACRKISDQSKSSQSRRQSVEGPEKPSRKPSGEETVADKGSSAPPWPAESSRDLSPPSGDKPPDESDKKKRNAPSTRSGKRSGKGQKVSSTNKEQHQHGISQNRDSSSSKRQGQAGGSGKTRSGRTRVKESLRKKSLTELRHEYGGLSGAYTSIKTQK